MTQYEREKHLRKSAEQVLSTACLQLFCLVVRTINHGVRLQLYGSTGRPVRPQRQFSALHRVPVDFLSLAGSHWCTQCRMARQSSSAVIIKSRPLSLVIKFSNPNTRFMMSIFLLEWKIMHLLFCDLESFLWTDMMLRNCSL